VLHPGRDLLRVIARISKPLCYKLRVRVRHSKCRVKLNGGEWSVGSELYPHLRNNFQHWEDDGAAGYYDRYSARLVFYTDELCGTREHILWLEIPGDEP
jgi:hypothetical protein